MTASRASAGPTTITISPRGSPAAAYSAASASSVPRRTSSCSLVSSRATAAGRGPELEREVGERLGEAARRFVEDERAGHGGERVDPLAPRGAPGRQKALEKEAVGRQAGDAERGERRGSAGSGGDRESRGDGLGDQLDSRDRRSSGVPASEISASAWPSRDAPERARARLGGVVLVIGR